MGFAGSWNEFWISKFSPCHFERIAAALRKVGFKGRKFGGTACEKAPALGYGISFPPVSNPRRVTIVTKFFSIGTDPQHEPLHLLRPTA
jgi:hypothetical protein